MTAAKGSAPNPGRNRRSRGAESRLAADYRVLMNGPSAAPDMEAPRLLSVVIPALDEASCIASTVEHLHLELRLAGVPHEIVVVDDGSRDGTWQILLDLKNRIDELKPQRNDGPHGFGRAVVWGLDHSSGDAVAIMMADESDDCRDVVRYWKELCSGYDCVFGSRFV